MREGEDDIFGYNYIWGKESTKCIIHVREHKI